MFLSHRPHHYQPPTSKIFISFPVFTLKNCLYIANCQFSLALCGDILFVFGWLVGNPLVATHNESRKFPKITQIHHFYKQKYLKNKNIKPHHFLKTVPD